MASKIDLRKFRHDISTLKKRGLISGVDARSVTPTANLKRLITRYDAVLSGKASAVKLSPKGVKEYKELGKPFEVAKPKGLPQRVIIPHEAGERVTVTHGKVRVANPAGVTRTILPVKFHNLESYLNKLRKQKVKLAPGEQLAFRYFDNRSIRTFRSMQSLIDYLSHYESVFDAIEENDTEAMQEIYQNLEIVKVEQPKTWKEPPVKRGSRKGASKSSAERYREYKQKIDEGPEYKRQLYLEKQRQRQADYRARLKGAALAKYKAAGRKRAKKSKRKQKRSKRRK